MPKQTKDDKALKKAESDYQASLDAWRSDKPSKPKKDKVDSNGEKLRAERKAYREAGEADGTRQFISIVE